MGLETVEPPHLSISQAATGKLQAAPKMLVYLARHRSRRASRPEWLAPCVDRSRVPIQRLDARHRQGERAWLDCV